MDVYAIAKILEVELIRPLSQFSYSGVKGG
jgi:hypothetical protein